tara:strand:- start:66 stop:242 length:177 start_codon:yes stop_codon:yes gene_type:complete
MTTSFTLSTARTTGSFVSVSASTRTLASDQTLDQNVSTLGSLDGEAHGVNHLLHLNRL